MKKKKVLKDWDTELILDYFLKNKNGIEKVHTG